MWTLVTVEQFKNTPHEAHTGDKAPSKINDDKQPGFLVGWASGHKDADIITFRRDGSVRKNGSWKYSRERRCFANDHELQKALEKMKNTKHTVQGCLS